ncbi:DUF1127 domain-containing protein [Pseudoroseicyclus tamaricis]|uniref:DUF1127 domain-containing protein n=1 Tax=Pseudoroseicyclus tamaricis TaxID=2705421 RepID=A0A6B2JPM1_9RHOB|nr:DUF1127 domain-containing protein [Pseudoroseicyclus tamaricis]NDV00627.1 DUF1127 domain-containing protein [Pseudoroseicyclus tamaricis]
MTRLAPSPPQTLTVAGQRGRVQLVRLLSLWRHRYSSRRKLARLDPALLKDIGLTDDAARTESEIPFWRP